ncbi:hypothetical protein [Sporomusa carbonis]|uniref:hypothetical protein n=1 Tax=Sporomusa carbonis TaxID=3076075 RepID=UPI003C7B380F
MGKPGLELVGMLPGIEVTDADAGCCGISGNYGFIKTAHPVAIIRAAYAQHLSL